MNTQEEDRMLDLQDSPVLLLIFVTASTVLSCGFADATETTNIAFTESAEAGPEGGGVGTGTSNGTSNWTDTQSSTDSGGTTVEVSTWSLTSSSTTSTTSTSTSSDEPICGDGIPEGVEECDDGNTTDDDGCSNKCKAGSLVVFVTSAAFNGELLGLSLLPPYKQPQGEFNTPLDLADAHCEYLAKRSRKEGVAGRSFKAWLSTKDGGLDTLDVADRLGLTEFKGAFVTTANGLVAEGWAELMTGTLQSRIVYTENGEELESFPFFVWTGTKSDGMASGTDCDGWSSLAGYGGYGDPKSKKGSWTDAGGLRGCNLPARLYCFEVFS